VRKPAETERNEAALADTPRAGLFREAKPALLALGISDSRTGGLIVQWLKLTNDDGPACAGLPGVVQGLSGEGAGGFDPAPQISAHRAVKG
jgi:hypothetical protein